MTFNPISHRQAQALAKLINSLRPDWDTHGIEAALGKARDIAPAPDLACAAIRAATSGHNRTPSVIAMEGPHWRASEVKPRHEEPHDGERCSVCFEAKPRCEAKWAADHRFLSVAATKQAAQDAREHVGELRALLPKHAALPETTDTTSDEDTQHAQAARAALRGTTEGEPS